MQGVLPLYANTHTHTQPSSQIARSVEPRPKKLHYVSEAVKFLLRTDVREQLKVVGAGVKVLERQDAKVSAGGWAGGRRSWAAGDASECGLEGTCIQAGANCRLRPSSSALPPRRTAWYRAFTALRRTACLRCCRMSPSSGLRPVLTRFCCCSRTGACVGWRSAGGRQASCSPMAGGCWAGAGGGNHASCPSALQLFRSAFGCH